MGTISLAMTTKIEELWSTLRREEVSVQRRVDARHPLDLYADFERPDRPGLVLFSQTCPPEAPTLKAIGIERHQRHDGRWSLRIFLEEARLLPVFAELCRDIIDCTRTGVDDLRASGVILSRIDRWRSLLQAEPSGLSRSIIRGLIGELLFLETELLPTIGPDEAVLAWTGPLGTDQDFRLPSGLKIEVKTVDRDADRVRINGLSQLDGGADPVLLAIVRVEDTGHDAAGALTAPRLIARIREQLSGAPGAREAFEALLRMLGWTDSNAGPDVVVRLTRIDHHPVTAQFPRLTPSSVPTGVTEASYTITIPPGPAT